MRTRSLDETAAADGGLNHGAKKARTRIRKQEKERDEEDVVLLLEEEIEICYIGKTVICSIYYVDIYIIFLIKLLFSTF